MIASRYLVKSNTGGYRSTAVYTMLPNRQWALVWPPDQPPNPPGDPNNPPV